MRYVALLAALAGCMDPDETTSETDQPSFVTLGNIYQGGTLVTFEEITNVAGLNTAYLVGLTACDPKTLFAVTASAGTYKILSSRDSGQTWVNVGAGMSREIACDHGHLATLDASKDLQVVQLTFDAKFVKDNDGNAKWIKHPNDVKVDRIQGGDGSFYGVKNVASGKDVYITTTRAVAPVDPNGGFQSVALAWTKIANVGATQVTGTGAQVTGTDSLDVINNITLTAWPRRAFALEANGTISTNSTLLENQNLWTWLNTGSERYTVLTAAAPNVLFGIQTRDNVTRINRITIRETSCFDGVDNDFNGLTDGEDDESSCPQTIANQFCASHAAGTYCSDRFQPSEFLDQTNQNSSLVTCGRTASIQRGVCQRGFASNADYLVSLDNLTPADPPETSHYCNVHWPDGSWELGWGADPCNVILKDPNKPKGGFVVRAGIYSTTKANHAFVTCNDGSAAISGAAGATPMINTRNVVPHTTNQCVFQISAGALPLFDSMWAPSHEVQVDRSVGPFQHNWKEVDLGQFGGSGTGQRIDRFGDEFSSTPGYREGAYDNPLDEGRPLLAPCSGKIIGARWRSLSGSGAGTPSQGEVYLQCSIGKVETYRETFVVYYAHVRRMLVQPEQTVKTGQILAYVGATGATGGYAHLHTGVFRLSNSNLHTPTLAAGWKTPFDLSVSVSGSGNSMGNKNVIDPLGWANGAGFDPWAYVEWNTMNPEGGFTGLGAWSLDLFKTTKRFCYPSPADCNN